MRAKTGKVIKSFHLQQQAPGLLLSFGLGLNQNLGRGVLCEVMENVDWRLLGTTWMKANLILFTTTYLVQGSFSAFMGNLCRYLSETRVSIFFQ